MATLHYSSASLPLRIRHSIAMQTSTAHSYRFRSDPDGIVKVSVRSADGNHLLRFEASGIPTHVPDLVLNWTVSRSHRTAVDPCDPDRQFSEPLAREPTGELTAELQFDSSQPPFFVAFAVGGRTELFRVPVGVARGSPSPLGVSYSDDGTVNFALFTRNAESVVLCLYEDSASEPVEIALDPYINRTGDTWHVSIPSTQDYVAYGYRCGNAKSVLLDPYAKLVHCASNGIYLGSLKQQPLYDWSGDVLPQIPMEQLVVYRLNIMQFTETAFAGVVKKIGHLKSLGVNAILLEPVFAFDDTQGPYFPYHFFSPVNNYGSKNDGPSAATAMKDMVKALHADGMEVLLEVPYTHTAEGCSLGGIDGSSYHGVDGNSLRCSNPVVQKLILDSVRYWAVDFHIDGFCFVNSSALLQDSSDGSHLPRPPLIEAIAFEPYLSKRKLIADCWSPLDMADKEARFPHWKRWAEVNSRFCSDVRNFLRGKGLLSSLATRLCGSGDVFAGSRGPAFSFNYITRNSGLPLIDLVSFSSKRVSSELSWNCGEEGPTDSKDILDLRLKQIRNFLFILFVSLGVPVLSMGDEYGISTGGSPSSDKRGPFNWNALKTKFAVQAMEFITFFISFRARRSDIFQVRDFHKEESIEWYGSDRSPPNWDDPSCKFLAMLLKAERDLAAADRGDVFVAINASDLPIAACLPQLPDGFIWSHLVDTALPYPGFFVKDGDPNNHQSAGLGTYELQPHSCALFESKASCD